MAMEIGDMGLNLLCISFLIVMVQGDFSWQMLVCIYFIFSIMEQDGCPLRMLVFIYLIPNQCIYRIPNHYGSGWLSMVNASVYG